MCSFGGKVCLSFSFLALTVKVWELYKVVEKEQHPLDHSMITHHLVCSPTLAITGILRSTVHRDIIR